jgi:hypothetical protein
MDEENWFDRHGETDPDKIYYNYIKMCDRVMYRYTREMDIYHDFILNGFYMFFQSLNSDQTP